ncbi:Sam-dependent methyltransferase like protein [Pleurostoma richardsiae]|uniref:Sam-dependent methyltransferase like protein n=1 Tax=Pleurostoma richardsiae TaxID=41990 RepID=A0AA38VE27_9PEZI|nr:Sam-dependent methyltransferase like protein [Pleurostoma richardsiae]
MGSLGDTHPENLPSTSAKVDTLLASCLYDESLRTLAYIPRFKHRLAILDAWSIPTGTGPAPKVLDIGCGQGESTLALALELGPDARITGIDPARPDYGVPITVAEAHKHALESPLGPRMRFLRADAPSLLQPSPGQSTDTGSVGEQTLEFDAAALCHSLWYFPDKAGVYSLFSALAGAGIPRVYLAEYDFESARHDQAPHVLAARAQALFHACKVPREPGTRTLNVRAAPDVATVREAARAVGFRVAREGHLLPAPDMLEGHFEARYTQGEKFAERVRVEQLPKEQEEEILAYGPRIKAAMEELKEQGLEHVRAMDVWWAELELMK